MFVAAPGELRRALQAACEREGVRVVMLAANNTTTTCHRCGTRCVWNHAAEVEHTCEHCGVAWDQDENAARNLLRLHAEAPTDDGSETTRRRTFSKRVRRPSPEKKREEGIYGQRERQGG
jgi:transposase